MSYAGAGKLRAMNKKARHLQELRDEVTRLRDAVKMAHRKIANAEVSMTIEEWDMLKLFLEEHIPDQREWEVLPSFDGGLSLTIRQPGEGDRGWIKVREICALEEHRL